jgi:phage terminase large subunit-like protein
MAPRVSPATRSRMAELALLAPDARQAFLDDLSDAEAAALEFDWPSWARPNQLPPPHNRWKVWLLLSGRGWG